jgi:hypothetical protein
MPAASLAVMEKKGASKREGSSSRKNPLSWLICLMLGSVLGCQTRWNRVGLKLTPPLCSWLGWYQADASYRLDGTRQWPVRPFRSIFQKPSTDEASPESRQLIPITAMDSRGIEAISGWCSVDMVKTPEIGSLVALNIEEMSRTEYILSL